MLPLEQPDRIQIAFDDHRLVANAGLLLPVTLAQRLGLPQLVDRHVDLGRAPGRANTGDKMLTLVASALAGGDCIDDAAVLRAGGDGRVLGCVVKAPSTLGTFLRSFRWGHVRQLDRVSRELLARAWAAGAGPGDGPLTIDLDSTVCETFGPCKEGAQRHNYAGQRGYHPILAVAAGTGDVLMARLRQGRANTVRGAAHFLRETVSRVRHAGATGQLTVRADSGFYAHAIVAVCRDKDVRFSITIRQHARLHNIIEAIPEEDWTAIPYWLDGAADVAETTYVPFESKPDAATVRLIVRRVQPTPGSQLALFANYSYHAFITDRDGDTLYLETDHRRHAEIENAIRDPASSAGQALKYGVGLNHLPSGRFPANPEPAEGGLAGRPEPAPYSIRGHGPQPGSLDNARRPGRATGHHQDPQAALLRSGRTAHPLSAPTHPSPAPGLALAEPIQQRSGETARPATPFLTAPDPPARLSTGLAAPRQAGTSVSTAPICPADLPLRNHLRSLTTSVRGAHSPHPAESLRIKALQPLSRNSHPCLARRDCIPSVDSGLSTAYR